MGYNSGGQYSSCNRAVTQEYMGGAFNIAIHTIKITYHAKSVQMSSRHAHCVNQRKDGSHSPSGERRNVVNSGG